MAPARTVTAFPTVVAKRVGLSVVQSMYFVSSTSCAHLVMPKHCFGTNSVNVQSALPYLLAADQTATLVAVLVPLQSVASITEHLVRLYRKAHLHTR